MAEAMGIPGASGRGVGRGAAAAEAIDHDLRLALSALLGQGDPRRIVLTSGATEAINLALLGIVHAAERRGRTPRIVTTQAEHNALRRPLLDLAARGRIGLDIVPAPADTLLDASRIIESARDADLVAMAWVGNATGAIQPLGIVARALRATRTLLLADASQAVGVLPPPQRDAAPDLLIFSGHKWLGGPPGIGGLVVGPRVCPADTCNPGPDGGEALLDPPMLGGTGSRSADPGMPPRLPHRFEPGTPNTPARAGLLAALRSGHDRGHFTGQPAKAQSLARRVREGLRACPGVRLLGPQDPSDAIGIVSFALGAIPPEDAATILEAEFGIIVRPGLHCAPGAHEAMGTLASGGALRASVGAETTPDEIESLVDAVRRIAGAS